jgi:hypothetical protein
MTGEFMICFTQHELLWVRTRAKDKEAARQKFESGDIDWDNARGYGDYGEPTINKITRLH